MSSPFGEAPSTIDLSANNTASNNAVAISVYVLAAIAIGLRFFARVESQKASIAADDYVMIAAFLRVTVVFALTIEGGFYGLGRHVWAVELPDVVIMMKIMFVYVLIYAFAVPLIKMSIILFYRRIFGMNWALWVCIFLTVGYWVSCWTAFLVACQPPSYFWTQYLDPTGGKCIFDLYPFYISNAAVNVCTDVLILLVPIPLVWKLQMRTAKKLLIIGIFLLGGFVCVASIVRIYFMTFLSDSVDVTWIMGDVFIWSSVEPCIGIVCGCLPTIRPLFRRAFRTLMSSKSNRVDSSSQKLTQGSGRNRRMLSGSNDQKFRHLNSSDGSQFRPRNEGRGLATCTTRVELNDLSRNEASDEEGSGRRVSASGITMKKTFRWIEERK